MSSKSTGAVLVFSRSPEHGAVKTRLRPVLGDELCLSLHLALLQDTLEKVRSLNLPAVLYLSGPAVLPFQNELPVRAQTGNDLGERMRNAFEECFHHSERIVIVGTDSPTFPPERIREALEALDQNEIVLGPSEDGGYYLIALRKPIPELFENIPWGTSTVMERTLKAAHGKTVFLLDRCFDVDVAEDLIRLKSEVTTAFYLNKTREWLRSYSAR